MFSICRSEHIYSYPLRLGVSEAVCTPITVYSHLERHPAWGIGVWTTHIGFLYFEYIHIYIYTRIKTPAYVYVYMIKYVYIYIHIHMIIHTTHIYTEIYLYMYTQTCNKLPINDIPMMVALSQFPTISFWQVLLLLDEFLCSGPAGSTDVLKPGLYISSMKHEHQGIQWSRNGI